MGKVNPIPEGFRTLTPHLVVRDAARAIEFYKKAFGAEVRGIHYGPDGKSIMHADLKIGDSVFMLNDEFPGMKCQAPQTIGGTSVTLHIYVDNVDALFNKAVAAGGNVTMPLMDAFWGDRYGALLDPFGHQWSFATHKQDLSGAEIEKAGKAAFAEMAKRSQHGS